MEAIKSLFACCFSARPHKSKSTYTETPDERTPLMEPRADAPSAIPQDTMFPETQIEKILTRLRNDTLPLDTARRGSHSARQETPSESSYVSPHSTPLRVRHLELQRPFSPAESEARKNALASSSMSAIEPLSEAQQARIDTNVVEQTRKRLQAVVEADDS